MYSVEPRQKSIELFFIAHSTKPQWVPNLFIAKKCVRHANSAVWQFQSSKVFQFFSVCFCATKNKRSSESLRNIISLKWNHPGNGIMKWNFFDDGRKIQIKWKWAKEFSNSPEGVCDFQSTAKKRIKKTLEYLVVCVNRDNRKWREKTATKTEFFCPSKQKIKINSRPNGIGNYVTAWFYFYYDLFLGQKARTFLFFILHRSTNSMFEFMYYFPAHRVWALISSSSIFSLHISHIYISPNWESNQSNLNVFRLPKSFSNCMWKCENDLALVLSFHQYFVWIVFSIDSVSSVSVRTSFVLKYLWWPRSNRMDCQNKTFAHSFQMKRWQFQIIIQV